MKIVVIGGTGLIGSKLVKKLRDRRDLVARKDPREVISDPHARYYGIAVSERTLVPKDDARLGATRFEDWLHATKPVAKTHSHRA